MPDNITPMGTSSNNVPTVMNVMSITEIYRKLMDYLKSINLPFMITDYGIKMAVNNCTVEMYIYNSTWVLHAIIQNESNSLSSDMYVKNTNTRLLQTMTVYEKERTKVWVKVKLTGNDIWDINVPMLAIATAVDIAGEPLSFLLPQSLQ